MRLCALTPGFAVREWAGPLALLCAGLAVPGPAAAQGGESAAATRGIELRLAVLGSTPLVRDEIGRVNQGGPVPAEAVQAGPGIAPAAGLALFTVLSPGVALEVSGGWTFARLVVREDGENRRAASLGVGQVLLALRHDVGGARVRGGIGAIRYASASSLLGERATRPIPLIEAGAGRAVRIGSRVVSIDVIGQAHGFGTPPVRDAGGSDGTVLRFGVQASVPLGRQR
jgi:hypothetical protein